MFAAEAVAWCHDDRRAVPHHHTGWTAERAEGLGERGRDGGSVSAEDLERYETEIELQLYQEYRAVLPMFRYVVETERRFYLTNQVKLDARTENGQTYFELELQDAWV